LDDSQELVIQKAYSEPKVIKFINDRSPKKIIYIKNKILNFIFK
jgi:leucyl-tRNA synthetase